MILSFLLADVINIYVFCPTKFGFLSTKTIYYNYFCILSNLEKQNVGIQQVVIE